MSATNEEIKPVEATKVRVKENGEVKELDYDGAMTLHTGSLWWGTAVGYRAMQAAAQALSREGLWSRDDIYVVSPHPGGGVRDAINFVTGAVDKGRYHLLKDGTCGMGCNSSMKFEWWVSDGKRTAKVMLRDGFVPRAFYELADRLGPNQTPEDTREFEVSKVNMATRIWVAPLEQNFTVEVSERPLAPGELPEEAKRPDYWDNIVTKQAKKVA